MKAPVKPDWFAVMFSVPRPMTLVPGPPLVIVLARLMTASAATALKLVLLTVEMPPVRMRVAPEAAPIVAPTPEDWVMSPEKVLLPLREKSTPLPSMPVPPFAVGMVKALATVTPPVSS